MLKMADDCGFVPRLSILVRWQSGDAADCKSAYAGSIPARTSNGSSTLFGRFAPAATRPANPSDVLASVSITHGRTRSLRVLGI